MKNGVLVGISIFFVLIIAITMITISYYYISDIRKIFYPETNDV